MIHRSFIIPSNAKEGKFTARVAQWLGVIAGPGSFILCALCMEDPDATPSSLILPVGTGRPLKAGEPEWRVSICLEGDEPPGAKDNPEGRYLGSVLTALGPAAVYVRRA